MINVEKYLTNLDEKTLFNLLKKYMYPDLIDLNKENEFTPIDFYSEQEDLWIEVKCRSKHYTNLVIEETKYNILKKKKNCLYICSTPRGIYQYDISNEKREIFFSPYTMKHSTYFENNERIPKTVGFIRYEDTIQIEQLLLKGFLF